MEIILKEKIRNLGKIGDVVKVKEGFARNYLFPKDKAVRKTTANLAQFEAQVAELKKKEEQALAASQARAASLNALVVTITAKAGEEGKLFGSISNRDISDAINQALSSSDMQVNRNEVQLPNGPLRHTGEYDIAIQLHSDVEAVVKIQVASEA